MATTPHLQLTLIEQSQAQKEVTANEAFFRIDALLNNGVIDKDLTAPPGSPAEGDVYIVAAGATGAWSGHASDIAYFDQVWRFIEPLEGITLWIKDESAVYRYNGTAWVRLLPATRKTALLIPAAQMRPSSSGGCAALATSAIGAGQPDIQTLDFDASAQEYAQFFLPMPKSWNGGTVTAQFLWSHGSTVTNFGVVWQLQGLACGDGDGIAASFGAGITVTDTGGATNTLYASPESSAITIGGSPVENDVVYFRLSRVSTDGADTLAVDAKLHGIRLFIQQTQYSDD